MNAYMKVNDWSNEIVQTSNHVDEILTTGFSLCILEKTSLVKIIAIIQAINDTNSAAHIILENGNARSANPTRGL